MMVALLVKTSTSRAVFCAAVGVLVSSANTAQAADKPNQIQRSPIATFKDGFTLEQSKKFLSERDLSKWMAGGDNSVWVNRHISEVLPTAVIPNRQPARELPKAINPTIGRIKAETKTLGTLSLDEFLAHPESYAQAFIVVHKGKIVYENYPGMQPTDHHLWMSVAKTLPALVIELLISDGKVDEKKTIGFYVPEFRGTAWENVRVKDVMDMTPGIDVEENDETRANPDSTVSRVFLAEFGMRYKGKQEILSEVLKGAKKVREAGTQFEYGSPTTQMLVYLAEAITGERWSQFVDKRIWSKLGAEGPMLMNTTPDGIALAHGLASTRLRDLARYGMLFTPSWNMVASERVVTPEIIERIREGVRSREFYRNGFDGPVFVSRLNDDAIISNSRQWDAVWPDGDFWKAGIMDQALYVSPDRDLVIAFFSVNWEDSIHRYLRPIATSKLFN